MNVSHEGTRRTYAALSVLAIVIACALVVAGASSAGRTSYAPPPGGPDLSLVALAPEDFQSAALARQGYVKPARDLGFVAEYDRAFTRAVLGSSKKRLASFEDDVSLAPNAPVAQRALESLALGLGLAAGELRAELAKEFGVKPAAVRITRPRKAGAGDDSVALRVALHTRSLDLYFLLAAVRVGPVVSFVYATGASGTALGGADTRRLATLVVRRTRVGLAPANTVLPTVAGVAQSGQSLSSSPGTWTNAPRLTYQWQACDSTGAACVDLVGATAPTVTLSDAVIGGTVRLAVTATNTYGSTTVFTRPTAAVSAAPPPGPSGGVR